MKSKKVLQSTLFDKVCIIMHTETTAQYSILFTLEFSEWFEEGSFKRRNILRGRFDKVAGGHFGDCKYFDGLLELRWKNGMRVYGFIWQNSFVVILKGGNKNGQSRDIKEAKKIREEIINGVRSFQ